MLPEFSRIKEQRQRMLMQFLIAQAHDESQLTRSLRVFRQQEGKCAVMRDLEGQDQHMGFDDAISSKIEVAYKELPELTNQRVTEKLLKMAKDLGSQMDRRFIEMLNRVTSESGNVVKVSGSISPEHFEAVVKQTLIDFDEHGNPDMPSMLVGSDTHEELKRRIPEWEADPENKKRMDALIEEKRAEWRDREADRKLVD